MKVLLIGVGGGALLHCLHLLLGEGGVVGHAVELDPRIAAVARQFFFLAGAHTGGQFGGLTLVVADAADFIRDAQRPAFGSHACAHGRGRIDGMTPQRAVAEGEHTGTMTPGEGAEAQEVLEAEHAGYDFVFVDAFQRPSSATDPTGAPMALRSAHALVHVHVAPVRREEHGR